MQACRVPWRIRWTHGSLGNWLIIWVSYEKPSSLYYLMWYFWWGCKGSLKLVTLGSESVKKNTHHLVIIRRVGTCVAPRTHPHLAVRVEIDVTLEFPAALIQVFCNVVGHLLAERTWAGVDVTAWTLGCPDTYIDEVWTFSLTGKTDGKVKGRDVLGEGAVERGGEIEGEN